MRNVRIVTITLAIMGLAVVQAGAQLIVNPSVKADYMAFDSEVVASFGSVDYDGDAEVERKVIGMYGAYGINDYMDLYGVLGWTIDAEPEDWGDSGMGWILAGGTRCAIYSYEPLQVILYAHLQYLAEDYGSYSEDVEDEGVVTEISVDAEGSILEFILGATARYDITEAFNLYGGLELVPYSSGEAEYSGDVWITDDSEDVERDNQIGIRLGTNIDLGSFYLRAEAAFVTEQMYSLAAAFRF